MGTFKDITAGELVAYYVDIADNECSRAEIIQHGQNYIIFSIYNDIAVTPICTLCVDNGLCYSWVTEFKLKGHLIYNLDQIKSIEWFLKRDYKIGNLALKD